MKTAAIAAHSATKLGTKIARTLIFMVILASYKVEYGQLHEMAPALGVRLLGTALVVISGFYRFPRQRTEWVSSPIIAAGSKWTTKSVPSNRTPKAPPIPFSSFL